MEAQVLNQKLEALVDSGSSVSIVDPELVKSLQKDFEPFYGVLSSASNTRIISFGQIKLNFLIGGLVFCHNLVLARTGHKLLLGTDFLLKHGMNLDFKNQKLLLNEKEIPVSIKASNGIASVRVSSTTNFAQRTTPINKNPQVFPQNKSDPNMLPKATEKYFRVAKNQSLQKGRNVIWCRIKLNGLLLLEPFVFKSFNSTPVVVKIEDFRNQLFPVLIFAEEAFDISKGTRLGRGIQIVGKEEIAESSFPINNISVDDFNLKDRDVAAIVNFYSHVFSNDLQSVASVDPFEIPLIHQDFKNEPLRRRSPQENKIIKEEIDKLLSKGIIRPSNSPITSQLVVVKKKDQTYRICVDFRRLNKITKKMHYPIPLIDELLDSFNGCYFFSSFDLTSGYNQIPLAEKDKWLTSFLTSFGQFEYNVLPFGLTNAPSQFQQLMAKVFRDHLGKGIIVYLDDVLIYSKTKEEHLELLKIFFSKIEEFNLKLKPSKCHIFVEELTFLGHLIKGGELHPDPTKVEVINSCESPKDLKSLKTFLGMSGYYRRFIPHYATTAEPLYALTKKGVKFNWSTECQNSFQKLKDCLVKDPIMASPDWNQEFIVISDASDVGLGCVLAQKQNGLEKVICYASRTLTSRERHYSAIERETLGVIFAFKKFRAYILGTKFTLVVDCQPLLALKNMKNINNSKIVRWQLFLEEFGDFRIMYKKGEKNSNADFLSRIPYNQETINSIQTNVLFQSLDLVTIKQEQKEDPYIKRIRNKDGFEERDDILYFMDRIVIPKIN